MTSEFLLSYADGRWHASGLGLDLAHAELRSLESLIEARLTDSTIECVAMRFDLSSLPRWLRQYQAHYFNYALHLPPRNALPRIA